MRMRTPARSGVIVLALIVVLVAAGGLGAPAGTPEPPVAAEPEASPGEGPTGAVAGPALGPRGPAPMARLADGLEILTPSAAPLLVGFHEASTPHAIELEPAGRLLVDRNPRARRPPDEPGGPVYAVLPSRGRGFPSTSSIDVAVPDGEPVLAPVSGTVVWIEPYRLYGRHDDVRIEIVADAAPELRIVLIHLEDVRVAVGDRVLAGQSVLAGSGRRFPFRSQIDEEVRRAVAHVHLEVQPIDAPRPFVSG